MGFQEDAEGRIWVAVNLGGLYMIEGLILERLQLRSCYELARYTQEQGFTGK